MAAVPVAEMTTHEEDDTRLDFDVESDLPRFLSSVLQKADHISQTNVDDEIVEQHIVVVDQTVSLLRTLRDSLSNINADDKQTLDNLSSAFSDVLSALQQCLATASLSPTTVAKNVCPRLKSVEPGKPAFDISAELLEDLLGLGFTHTKIAEMLGVSRWTISRRIKDYGLEDFRSFSKLTDDELDEIIRDYIREHGTTTGQVYIAGYVRSLGLRVQRRRVRKCLARLDPQNTALRWGIVVSRRVYQVPWPNSLWHLDGHHSLIRWKLVIHGCIDGYSRRIIFLKCNSNNLAETVLDLFLDAVNRDGDRWPSRIRVDRGVENVLVCEAMVQFRGEGRASFIAGPSTHNQRIERLWREVYRCVCHLYYYTFYAMESSGLLNIEDPIQLFTLHTVFIPRINNSLNEFSEAFNNHAVSTEGNWTPYQMWMNGMMHANNPLAHGDTDGEPDDLQLYGYDPEGPSPSEEDNNVVVEPITFDNRDLIESYVLDAVDPLMQSTQLGIDLYIQALDLVRDRMDLAND